MGVVGRGVERVEADLVGDEAQVRPGVVGVHAVVVADALHPELGPEVVLRQVAGGRRVGVVHHQAERVFPAAQDAQAVELVLLEDVGGEPVGVGAGVPLGAGEQINLPVSLLEGLDDLLRLQPLPPTRHIGGRRAQGMP